MTNDEARRNDKFRITKRRFQTATSSFEHSALFRHSSFVIRASSLTVIKDQMRPAKNGLCSFSSPTVVIGPCPGQMIVSSDSVRIFSTLFCNASWYETLPPPIDPAKSESPTTAIGCARPVTTYVIPPGE